MAQIRANTIDMDDLGVPPLTETTNYMNAKGSQRTLGWSPSQQSNKHLDLLSHYSQSDENVMIGTSRMLEQRFWDLQQSADGGK